MHKHMVLHQLLITGIMCLVHSEQAVSSLHLHTMRAITSNSVVALYTIIIIASILPHEN